MADAARPPRSAPTPTSAAIVAGLALLTVLVYRDVGSFPFIDVWDDGRYVSENPAVLGGLSLPGLRWAFASFHASNWHPLTWLSHMLDVELFGPGAGRHHEVNVVLHAANAILLYLLLARATGRAWRSAAVAALFAVHPLHVESVAWVSERKDVLSTLFGFLAILCYLSYSARRSVRRYLPVLLFHAMSLLSKPMLVTLPLLLLLLDAWPLGAFRARNQGAGLARAPTAVRLVLEKVPLLLLSLASAAATLVAQKAGGALSTLDEIPASARLGNAVVAAAAYVGKAAWPSSLAAVYPHPATLGRTIPPLLVLGAGCALAAVSWWAVRSARKAPFLAVGWSWYLVSLLPAVGIVQVGVQSMADRYTYVPLVGIFVAAAWGMPAAARRLRIGRRPVAAAAAVAVAALSVAAARQVSFWHDGFTLFRRAAAVTPDNWVARHHIGALLERQGDFVGAEASYREVLRLRPGHSLGYSSLGVVAQRQGRPDEAWALHLEALRIDPDCFTSRFGLGNILLARGAFADAADAYRGAARLRPRDFQLLNNLGFALLMDGRVEEAVRTLRDADGLSFGSPLVRKNLEEALAALREGGRGAPSAR